MTRSLVILGALALTACGDADQGNVSAEGGNEAPAEAKAETAPAPRETAQLRPGLWEVRMELPTIPDMPKEVAEMMPREMTVEQCITPEKAESSSPEIFGAKETQGCTTSGAAMSGGKMRRTLTCPGEGGEGPTRMVMEGTFSPESYDIEMRATGAGGEVTETRVVGRRIGDCPATGDGPATGDTPAPAEEKAE